MSQTEQEILAGKRLFSIIICLTVLIQGLTIWISFRNFGMSQLGLLFIILALQCIIMFVAFRGNQRATLYVGVILIASAFNALKYKVLFENMPFYQWYQIITGLIFGIFGLLVLTSPSINAFVKNQGMRTKK